MLLTHRPGSPLCFYVEALWYYEGYETANQKERVLPTGRFQIVINLSTGLGIVCGMRSQYIDIEPAKIHMVIGVVFRPGGAHGLFDVPASDFYNRIVRLDQVWPAKRAELIDRVRTTMNPRRKLQILEVGLQELFKRRTLHPAMQCALWDFQRRPHVHTVSDFSAEIGLSRRRFSHLFREQIGMTPKLYCRLIRFQEVVRQVRAGGPVNWADIAVAGGYSDQAHLVHEFREFSGLTPTSYLEAERPHANHIRLD
jgi:AraC-like DNA-binding protein